MNYSSLRTIATVLSVVLFLMPLMATAMITAQSNSDAQQYAGLQAVVMGIYNIPFVAVALLGLSVGQTFQKKNNFNAANISLGISICASVVGSLLMLTWGTGQA